MIPFAVVGSDQEYQVNGRRLLGRKTKWGTIEGTTLSPPSFSFSVLLFKFVLKDTLRTESVNMHIANLEVVLLRRKDKRKKGKDLTESVSQ